LWQECSWCLQARGLLKVKVQVITRDDATGQLFNNGKPVARGFIPESPSRYATKVAARKARAAADDQAEDDAE
jgi:hypothetical protein